MKQQRVKVLVLPVFKRHWLWHAWPDPAGAAAAAEHAAGRALPHWREGVGWEEKFQLLSKNLSQRVQKRIFAEWRKLEQAKEGSWKNWAYRAAQSVLAREDPAEIFLKSVPAEPADVEVIYPALLTEKRVRRRLRLLVAEGHRKHRSRVLWWALALLPQLPLMVTPLPNVTVYYTGYRLYSNYRALQGSKALERAFSSLDSRQLRALRDDLLWYQEYGGQLRAGEWPAKLIHKSKEYLDILSPERLWQRLHPDVPRKLEPAPGEAAEEPPSISFTPSVQLSEFVKPLDRQRAPLDDEAVMSVCRYFEKPHLLDLVARARKKAVGTPFPHMTSSGQLGW